MDLVRSRSSNSLEASTTYLRNCGNRHDPRPSYGDRQPVRTPRRTMDEKDVSPEKMVAMQPDQVHLTIWAKGRVERNHGTHQDRLVKKLRRKNIQSYQAGNEYLEREYLEEHNERSARPAASSADYHRQAPSQEKLDDVFRLESKRVISND